jgi:UDP-2,3-diacylglucosamine pyrophosphatase LpxH
LGRTLFVISDLHIGGRFPGEEGERGFRMMTRSAELAAFIRAVAAQPPPVELVINGDFIDFLAEEHEGDARWTPFIDDPARAVAVFEALSRRGPDAEVFDALGELLAAGGQLTVLLGNHDLELSLPPVRAALERRIGLAPGHRYRFLYDGEAYPVGRALIEHGNRYDPFNVVDHDALRRLRSLISRGQLEERARAKFSAPAGSHVVAEVMNPFKADFAFVDLLKPEGEALFALILALDPGRRRDLKRVLALAAGAQTHGTRDPAMPRRSGDISSRAGGMGGPRPMGGPMGRPMGVPAADPLDEALGRVWSPEDVWAAGGPAGQDIASKAQLRAYGGLAGQLLRGNRKSIEGRLAALRKALLALEDPDRVFDAPGDEEGRYLKAAAALSGRFQVVVFGHTHFYKDVPLPGGGRYLNTGTWANLMRFPRALLGADEAAAKEALWGFFEDMEASRLEGYLEFRPTYARLVIDPEGEVTEAGVHTFEGAL